MTREPVKLHFKNEVEPHAVHTPIPVPHHWKKQIKDDLDRDVRLGIIVPVPESTTSEWFARMVVNPKKNSNP